MQNKNQKNVRAQIKANKNIEQLNAEIINIRLGNA